MALDGIIFDLDGTLLDTNMLHTRAWARAFEQFGYRLGEDRIALEIGKGGDMLVPALVGLEAEDQFGSDLRAAHGEEYRRLIADEGARVYPAVEALFDACQSRGLWIAVATASEKENLDRVLDVAGLDLESLVDEIVTDTDVEESKPNPDVVLAACRKLGLAPGQCVMVGDTPYDGQAAAAAGVACIGLLTGVHDTHAMRRSGMRAVFRDAEDLLAHLDEALEAVSPGEGHLTHELLQELMAEAVDEAASALKNGDFPGGAVVARSDGTIVARGSGYTMSTGRPLSHAEIRLLMDLEADQLALDDLLLVTAIEPCAMCFAAAVEAGIDTIVFGLEAPERGGRNRLRPEPGGQRRFPRVIGGVRREEVREVFDQWLQQQDDPPAAAQQVLGR